MPDALRLREREHRGGSHVAVANAAGLGPVEMNAVDETMVALLGELAASGHRLALLSNIPEELAAHYEIQHSWLEMFQVRGFSCRIGHAKPNPAAFRWCLDALAVPADQVVFVDDRGENIQAAQTIGIRCHLFTTPHASANSSPLEPSNPSCRRPPCVRLSHLTRRTLTERRWP
jgi:FMN phosphatase YigB (HAD superfamily)